MTKIFTTLINRFIISTIFPINISHLRISYNYTAENSSDFHALYYKK